jgi:outer membrane usher protein
MRFRLVLAALLASASLAEARQPLQTFLPLIVNDVPKGEVPTAIDGDQVWMPVADLEKAGLKGFAGRRDTLFGAPHVLLNSLAPDILMRLDMAEVVLSLTADPKYFDENRVVLQFDRPAGLVQSRSSSGYLNYSATWDQAAGTTGYGEAGLSLYGRASLASSFDVDAEGTLTRGLSSLSLDRPSARQRWEFGDTVSRSTPLGSAPIVAGVSFGRDYSLDPYYYRYPSPSFRGTSTTRSDVEIYINGALVRRLQIGPGPYRFDRLPLNSGLGDVRVVVRDPLGRQQIFDANVYLATGVLKQGEQDYQYVAGALRDDTTGSPTYGDVQGTLSHRVGVTDWLTLGVGGEGNQDVVTGGPTLSLKLARLGELELNTWVSQTASDQQNGFAGYGLYSFVGRWLNLSAVAQYYDPGYANIYLRPGDMQTPEYYQANVGVPILNAGSLTYTWEQKRSPAGTFGFTLPDGTYDSELVRSRAHTLRTAMRVLPATQLTATATYTQVKGQHIWTGYAGLNVVLGSSTTAGVTYSRLIDQTETTYADISKSLPVGVGYGYRLSGSDVANGTANGQFELNSPFSLLRLNYDLAEGGDRTNGAVTLAGGVIASGGGVFFTRPLDSSAAVVEVTGLPNVRILADNVEVARTGGGGKALVPRLLPYLANRISYDEADIPFDYKVPVSSQLIAPPFRGAAHVKFLTSRIQARAGSVRFIIAGEEVVPGYGNMLVTTADGDVESPLNVDGEFFLDLPTGHHRATVTFKGQSCDVEFEATAKAGLIQQLGVLKCTP